MAAKTAFDENKFQPILIQILSYHYTDCRPIRSSRCVATDGVHADHFTILFDIKMHDIISTTIQRNQIRARLVRAHKHSVHTLHTLARKRSSSQPTQTASDCLEVEPFSFAFFFWSLFLCSFFLLVTLPHCQRKVAFHGISRSLPCNTYQNSGHR